MFGSSDSPESWKETTDYVHHGVLSNKLWESADFVPMSDNLVGTHSLHKFPSAYAYQNSTSSKWQCWVSSWSLEKTRFSDACMDVTLPYPDAKVASILCIGGPCKYVLAKRQLWNQWSANAGWLTTHVVPALASRARISDKLSLLLAKPVLWDRFDDQLQSFLAGCAWNHQGASLQGIPKYLSVGWEYQSWLTNAINRLSQVMRVNYMLMVKFVGLDESFDGSGLAGESGGDVGNARTTLAEQCWALLCSVCWKHVALLQAPGSLTEHGRLSQFHQGSTCGESI